MKKNGWQFWIDRGGTFTDIVAKNPAGEFKVHKLLSEDVNKYVDAPVQGIREVMGLDNTDPIKINNIDVIKMGTTVATNALLERQGERTVLVTTKGFKDILRIGYQNRPDIFAREIKLPEMLYERVIEVEERYTAEGRELISLTDVRRDKLIDKLEAAYEMGIRSCAIVLMHGYQYPKHEKQIGRIARDIGFSHVSLSHQVSPLMKLVSRGDTTVADAYLSPVLGEYINRFIGELTDKEDDGLTEIEEYKKRLLFMQSNGGLIDADNFKGKDSILSGPAGGIVGAVQVCKQAGFDKIVTFDMGGTSTDVAHYNGKYERDFETEIAGIRLRTPVLSIHTVAAGGGSVVDFDGARYRVGPESAGADPGPACYRKGGPLTVTDCNVMLGRIQPDFFPAVFGQDGDLPLDNKKVRERFNDLADQINQDNGGQISPEEVASGFLEIAIENMANAIKEISLQRGYDLLDYTLCCFGGAGGQHACQIAEKLGIEKVLIHPYAGVLSAYGMGLANIRVMKQQAIKDKLDSISLNNIKRIKKELTVEAKAEMKTAADVDHMINSKVHLKYEGSDFTLQVGYKDDHYVVKEAFAKKHKQLYGFIYEDRDIILESISIEVIQQTDIPEERNYQLKERSRIESQKLVKIYERRKWVETPVYLRENLHPGDSILGPALIIEKTGTNVVLSGWQAEITELNHLLLKRLNQENDCENTRLAKREIKNEKVDPVLLEIFNNLYRFVAEQMGTILQKTAFSVNIKERLDFSCAVFDKEGNLVANAPHIPVHLGSMSEGVKALIKDKSEKIRPGDVFAANNPYNGGTHLPDITVITPVFVDEHQAPIFYVASRGHHADIGGITPGSMPPFSKHIKQEGVLLDNFKIVNEGRFMGKVLKDKLLSGKYPVRNFKQNLTDIKAQIAANEKGMSELEKIVKDYGLQTVISYMQYVQDNAEEAVRKTISSLKDGEFECEFDSGEEIKVKVSIDQDDRSATIDFTGTSKQTKNNLNAPIAVTKAAIIYVFRCLVDDNIPLNDGCLKPLKLIIPEGSMLNPNYPAAVVAGNVETSQLIVDTLLGALDVMAASQGTMNNFTFGNEEFQYYETICGGSGASGSYDGTDAVHTHMTNSRLTDPEVLEWRFPVMVDEFRIREDSGGEGCYQGGDGVIRKIRFMEKMEAAILSNRRKTAPFGLKGGSNGLPGNNYVIRSDGQREELSGIAVVKINSDDVFIIETPGGGGYGKKFGK